MNVVGCDPGMTGAFAILVDRVLVDVIDMPVTIRETGKNRVVFDVDNRPKMKRATQRLLLPEEIARVFGIIALYAPATLFIEQVNERPGQSGMFSFGRGLGLIEMAAFASNIPVATVAPNTWQHVMRGSSDKKKSLETARHLFPGYSETFKRQMDHGRADAALIGMYGVRLLAGEIVAPKGRRV
jgi:crossover junction endodeoxyribonuclease RuvC